jgi:hypothetical protein
MALIARESGGGKDFDPIPEGVHIGRCYGVVDLGTHHNAKFDRTTRKVLLQWEIPSERIELERDGQKLDLPRAISKSYTLSVNEKAALRKLVEAWIGRKLTATELAGFDVKSLLGKACQIQIVHVQSQDGSRTYANIGAIMALPKGTPVPKPENALQYFAFEEGVVPQIEGLPEWIQKVIHASDEWQAINAPAKPKGQAPPSKPSEPMPWDDPEPPDPDIVAGAQAEPQEMLAAHIWAEQQTREELSAFPCHFPKKYEGKTLQDVGSSGRWWLGTQWDIKPYKGSLSKKDCQLRAAAIQLRILMGEDKQ